MLQVFERSRETDREAREREGGSEGGREGGRGGGREGRREGEGGGMAKVDQITPGLITSLVPAFYSGHLKPRSGYIVAWFQRWPREHCQTFSSIWRQLYAAMVLQNTHDKMASK